MSLCLHVNIYSCVGIHGCCGILLLHTVKISNLDFFSKTLTGQYHVGSIDVMTKLRMMKEERVWSCQVDAEGAGNKLLILIKVLPHGRV